MKTYMVDYEATIRGCVEVEAEDEYQAHDEAKEDLAFSGIDFDNFITTRILLIEND